MQMTNVVPCFLSALLNEVIPKANMNTNSDQNNEEEA